LEISEIESNIISEDNILAVLESFVSLECFLFLRWFCMESVGHGNFLFKKCFLTYIIISTRPVSVCTWGNKYTLSSVGFSSLGSLTTGSMV
jgi:hypothetical protein